MASSSLLFVPLKGITIRKPPQFPFSSSTSWRCAASLNDSPEKNKFGLSNKEPMKKATLLPETQPSLQPSPSPSPLQLTPPLKLAHLDQQEDDFLNSNQLLTTNTPTPDESPPDESPVPVSSKSVPSPAVVAASVGFLALAGSLAWAANNPDITFEVVLHTLEEFIAGPRFLVSIGMGLSAFIQALTGFGFAVISVGAMTQLDWVVNSSVFEVVQPLAASLGALTGWALLLPEIKKVNWADLSTILIASTIATPFGVLLLEFVDAKIILKILGALISGYVSYSVTGVEVPKKFGGTAGAWVLGLLAGGLGGAFDITGPPLVVHGEAAKWEQTDGTFRRNVLAVVSINSSIVVFYDLCVGRLADYYYLDFVKYAMPAVVVGIVAGNYLSKRLDPAAFKKIVLATCMGLGAKLLFT